MISEDEARSAIEFQDCFVVQYNADQRDILLAQAEKHQGKACPEGFTYRSDSNTEWMTVNELKEMVERIADDYAIEKSRFSMTGVSQ